VVVVVVVVPAVVAAVVVEVERKIEQNKSLAVSFSAYILTCI